MLVTKKSGKTKNRPYSHIKVFIFLSLLGVSVFSSLVNAQTFSRTTSLNNTARGQSASLLDDGRVLIIGTNVEIYDPATRRWTVKNPMNSPRTYHTATKLRNGKILVAGGRNSDALSSCELYDIKSDTWTTVGSLQVARSEPRATLLNSGKVLVTAGDGLNFVTQASAELFDPGTNSWSSAGTMTDRRSRHGQVLLDNGEVMVAGGRDWSDFNGNFPFPALSSVEIYTPSSNSWRIGTPMNEAHYSGAMIKLRNGSILMATGGKLTPGTLIDVADHTGAEIYDPIADSWTPTGKLNTARRSSRVSMLCDGRVFVNGGFERNDTVSPETRSAEIYDPSLGSWTEVGPMPNARSQHSSTLLADCNVLIVGGIDDGLEDLNSAFLFDPFGLKKPLILAPILMLLDE